MHPPHETVAALVGRRIRRIRLRRRLSLAQLAAQVCRHGQSLSRGQIGKIELGQGTNIEKYQALAAALGVSRRQLLG